MNIIRLKADEYGHLAQAMQHQADAARISAQRAILDGAMDYAQHCRKLSADYADLAASYGAMARRANEELREQSISPSEGSGEFRNNGEHHPESPQKTDGAGGVVATAPPEPFPNGRWTTQLAGNPDEWRMGL